MTVLVALFGMEPDERSNSSLTGVSRLLPCTTWYGMRQLGENRSFHSGLDFLVDSDDNPLGGAEVKAFLLRMPRYWATWQTPTGCVLEPFQPHFRITSNPFEALRIES
jgi:hypothetical protein